MVANFHLHGKHAIQDDLVDLADHMATSIRRQWSHEATWRQLNDPYAMPVRWTPAEPSLVTSWPTLTRLATEGPGWPSRPDRLWAESPAELAGTANDLVDVLDRIPTGRLVLLGEPGAGKTVLLIRLVLDLLSRRAAGEPVPVLLPVASWDPQRENLAIWMERRLTT